MPSKYTQEAIETCLALYLKYGGGSHELIEAEMRRAGYASWSRQNLVTRGDKIGWIEKYGWEAQLKIKIATSGRAAATSAERLFLEIEQARERIKAALDAQGGTDRDLVYQHRDYCKLSVDALVRLESARDSLDSFVAMYERLTTWLAEESPQATAALLACSDQIIERARKHYGGK